MGTTLSRGGVSLFCAAWRLNGCVILAILELNCEENLKFIQLADASLANMSNLFQVVPGGSWSVILRLVLNMFDISFNNKSEGLRHIKNVSAVRLPDKSGMALL